MSWLCMKWHWRLWVAWYLFWLLYKCILAYFLDCNLLLWLLGPELLSGLNFIPHFKCHTIPWSASITRANIHLHNFFISALFYDFMILFTFCFILTPITFFLFYFLAFTNFRLYSYHCYSKCSIWLFFRRLYRY